MRFTHNTHGCRHRGALVLHSNHAQVKKSGAFAQADGWRWSGQRRCLVDAKVGRQAR